MSSRPIDVDDLERVLHATASLWEGLRERRIFITGGTGFFGCWLLESFCYINRSLRLNATATVLTRSPAAFSAKASHLASDPSVTLISGDVRDFAYPDGEFDFVIHAATDASPPQTPQAPFDTFDSIVTGTQRTLEFAASHGSRRFLLTSSGAVYGRQPADITHLPETYHGAPNPLEPSSVYAEGKRAAELMCALYQKTRGLECAIARCWAFCGAHLPLQTHFAIGNFIGDVIAGGPIRIAGDGTPMRSYLYGSDLTIWLWTMLFEAPSLVPINVGSSEETSILDLAKTVAAALNPKVRIEVATQPVAGAPPLRYVPSVSRAQQLLKLKQTVTLEEMILRTARWHGYDPR